MCELDKKTLTDDELDPVSGGIRNNGVILVATTAPSETDWDDSVVEARYISTVD